MNKKVLVAFACSFVDYVLAYENEASTANTSDQSQPFRINIFHIDKFRS